MEKYTEWKKEIEKIISQVEGSVCINFYDLNKNNVFSINGDKKVLSASMIKLLILAELMKKNSENKFSLSDTVMMANFMKIGGDGVLKELNTGHHFTLKELATLMIIISDNQATNILIDFLGMENINQLGKELDLKETFLGRKMMDAEARKKGYDNYTCADDISLLLKLIYQEKLINKEASQLILDILLRQQQGERLQRYLPSDIKIAHKCGDLDNLENDGGIIWLGDRAYILVVLTNGMPNLQCKQTIGKISKFIYDKMEE
ncbi:class A beta-lactamase-related serine hydrolase [Fusobacterium nucleatum]|uniref:serine hydrolase n=1 Tax=Fusobacterium vincentii TaxID=155615 RepID=UPI0003FB9D76|nr:serine hydrolase [Fusobacterium vincentii]ALF19060.1 serine hydrolase [Fusobacterium vincentii ChDC F8]PIH01545.1 serine hydrolase [Fusobacterium vincentii]